MTLLYLAPNAKAAGLERASIERGADFCRLLRPRRFARWDSRVCEGYSARVLGQRKAIRIGYDVSSIRGTRPTGYPTKTIVRAAEHI